MCTSLGQLVDRKRLYETVALFRLEEAERRRQSRMEKMDYYNQFGGGGTAGAAAYHPPASPVRRHHANGFIAGPPESTSIQQSKPSAVAPIAGTATLAPPTIPDPVPLYNKMSPATLPTDVAPSLPAVPIVGGITPRPPLPPAAAARRSRPVLPSIGETKQATLEPDKAEAWINLVKMDTNSLRQAVPLEDIRQAERRDRRRNRRKSVSDGVALMSAVGKGGNNFDFFGGGNAQDAANKKDAAEGKATEDSIASFQRSKTVDDSALLKRKERKMSRKRAMSASAAILAMRNFSPGEGEQNVPEEAKQSGAGEVQTADDSAILDRKERRRNRKKAVSASAAIVQMRNGPDVSKTANSSFFNNWTNRALTNDKQPPTQAGMTKSEAPEPGIASVSKPTLFQQPQKKLFGSADDSTTAATAGKQSKERRRTRLKSLSASAAVKLMVDAYDDDDERAQEQKSMMEFWGVAPSAASSKGEDTPRRPHDPSMESLSESERRLQSQSFLDSLDNKKNIDTMLMPLDEVPAHLEESSGHFDDPLTLSPTGDSTSMEPDPLETWTLSGGLFANGGEASKSRSEDGGGDDDTVETDRSVGGLSHVSDASDLNDFRRYPSLVEGDEDGGRLSISMRFAQLNEKMRRFLLTKQYSFCTHMLGTTLCFFIIGMRIERFLKYRCLIPFEDNSWVSTDLI